MADPLDELPVPRDLQIPRGRLPAGGDAVADHGLVSAPVASTDLLARASYALVTHARAYRESPWYAVTCNAAESLVGTPPEK